MARSFLAVAFFYVIMAFIDLRQVECGRLLEAGVQDDLILGMAHFGIAAWYAAHCRHEGEDQKDETRGPKVREGKGPDPTEGDGAGRSGVMDSDRD